MKKKLLHSEKFQRPRKSLGQNFLHQQGVIQSILEALNPGEDDIVLEIGPGRGALTIPLLEKVKLLHVVELDPVLADYWNGMARGLSNLVVHQADILKFDLESRVNPGSETRLRLIGNLPYNISSPILFHLLAQAAIIGDMHLMFQLEVAQRLVSRPGSKQYGRLSVMVQQRCFVEMILRVAPGSFSPPPKVDSAVVRLIPFDDPPVPVPDNQAFSDIVRSAFSMRRKTLRNALRDVLSDEQIREAGVDPTARAEQLSVQEFAALTEVYVDSRGL